MNNTNMYDVFVVFFAVSALVALAGIAGYLVIKGHPWFGFFVLLIASCLRVKTGS